jgi:hypothetical protein
MVPPSCVYRFVSAAAGGFLWYDAELGEIRKSKIEFFRSPYAAQAEYGKAALPTVPDSASFIRATLVDGHGCSKIR